jgi:hypothetical protein
MCFWFRDIHFVCFFVFFFLSFFLSPLSGTDHSWAHGTAFQRYALDNPLGVGGDTFRSTLASPSLRNEVGGN